MVVVTDGGSVALIRCRIDQLPAEKLGAPELACKPEL